MDANHRLAIYGTLAPGKPNHGEISDLKGIWTKGTIRGKLITASQPPHTGLTGLILDPLSNKIDVDIFESAELPDHWPRLDAFEGSEFERVTTRVQTDAGNIDASIYVIRLL